MESLLLASSDRCLVLAHSTLTSVPIWPRFHVYTLVILGTTEIDASFQVVGHFLPSPSLLLSLPLTIHSSPLPFSSLPSLYQPLLPTPVAPPLCPLSSFRPPFLLLCLEPPMPEFFRETAKHFILKRKQPMKCRQDRMWNWQTEVFDLPMQ